MSGCAEQSQAVPFAPASYAAALAIPAGVVLALVLRHGVNVPFWDQWELVGLLAAASDGTLTWAEIFRQHNEHRMVFPKIIMLALAALTGWNVVGEMLGSIGLAAISLALLVRLAQPALRRAGPSVRLWAAFTLSAIVFSLAQWQNWVWGWQIQWFVGALSLIAVVALATDSLARQRPWAHVAGAAAAAVVCQFSIASGLFAWASGALILACHPRRRAIVAAWLAAALLATAVFFVGYGPVPGHPASLAAVDHPLAFLLFVGNVLSGPLGRHAAVGLAAGAGFVALATVALRRTGSDPRLALPWVSLGAFAFAHAVLAGIGRVEFGATRGLSSHYVTIALLLPVGLVPLGAIVAAGSPRRLRWGLGAVLLTGLVLAGNVGEWKRAADHAREMRAGRDCLLSIETAADACLARLYPDPAALRYREAQLRILGWSGYAK